MPFYYTLPRRHFGWRGGFRFSFCLVVAYNGNFWSRLVCQTECRFLRWIASDDLEECSITFSSRSVRISFENLHPSSKNEKSENLMIFEEFMKNGFSTRS